MQTFSVAARSSLRGADDRYVVRPGSSGWIVCTGATREVSRGMVHCPRSGTVDGVECLACHLLETVVNERDPRRACSTED